MTQTTPSPAVDLSLARKVLNVVDAGLSSGLGEPKPGHMSVNAAVCYAMGLPHGDKPPCEDLTLWSFKASLNDRPWSSPAARADGLRRLAIASLGSAGKIDGQKFAAKMAEHAIKTFVPMALRSAAKLNPASASKLEAAAVSCETTGNELAAREAQRVAAEAADAATAEATSDADSANAVHFADVAAYVAHAAATYAADAYVAASAYAADAAAFAAYAVPVTDDDNRDYTLRLSADHAVTVLRELGAPGIALMDALIPA